MAYQPELRRIRERRATVEAAYADWLRENRGGAVGVVAALHRAEISRLRMAGDTACADALQAAVAEWVAEWRT